MSPQPVIKPPMHATNSRRPNSRVGSIFVASLRRRKRRIEAKGRSIAETIPVSLRGRKDAAALKVWIVTAAVAMVFVATVTEEGENEQPLR